MERMAFSWTLYLYFFADIVRFFNICCAWNGYSWNLRSHGQRQCSRIEPTLLSSAGMQLMVSRQLNVSNSECQCGEYDNTWRTWLQICSFTFRFTTALMPFWKNILKLSASSKPCFKNLSHEKTIFRQRVLMVIAVLVGWRHWVTVESLTGKGSSIQRFYWAGQVSSRVSNLSLYLWDCFYFTMPF